MRIARGFAALLFIAAIPAAGQVAESPQTVPPEGNITGEPSVPATPLTRKDLEKKIKDAGARAKRAGHNASHQNRVADQLARQKRYEESDFARKVANGFLRERGEALNEAAEAKRLLADLKAGRKPQPSTPVADKKPEPPVEPAPGTPGEPSAGGPEANTKPAPGAPGGDKPVSPPEPAKPADPAGTRLEGSLSVIQDPDTHPHTLCRRLETLPLIARFLLGQRVQLVLGSSPPLDCPMDCEGPDDEFCTGECMGDLAIDGQPLRLRLQLVKPLLRPTEAEIPALSKLPIVGRLFVRPVGRENDAPLLLLIRPRILTREGIED